MQACERLSLQFLDGTVAFARLTIVRAATGRLAVRRTYVFDYTANSIERRQGFVVLTGLHVDSVGFAPEPPGSVAQVEKPPSAASGLDEPQDGNVLDLQEWRTRRKRG
jgi:hypothetical protein